MQGEPVKPPKPTQGSNGAFRLPWQAKGEKKSPLPSPPQPTSPARAVSIATGASCCIKDSIVTDDMCCMAKITVPGKRLH